MTPHEMYGEFFPNTIAEAWAIVEKTFPKNFNDYENVIYNLKHSFYQGMATAIYLIEIALPELEQPYRDHKLEILNWEAGLYLRSRIFADEQDQTREALGNLYRRLATIESQLEDREGPPSEFSEWCPKFLPHYFAGPPADFHEVLFTSLDHAISQRGLKWALIAPRSGAKSTIITLAYALRCAVEGLERYTIILSDSYEQAVEHIESIKGELEDNELIAEQYPEAAGIGPTWRTNFLVLRNGCAIRAIGTGGKVRGRRRRESRPSLIILDDVENNSSITSASKRDKAWRWVTREVIPASGVGTNFISVGSALHRDCVAIRLQKLPGWEEQTCKAIHTWPTRMELWDEWENILYNLADDDRLLHARNYYLSHREAMDEGSSIYWPDRFPLYDLMLRRAEMGSPGFNTEYQGIPSNEDYTEFDPEWFEDRPNKPFWFDSMPPPNRIAYKIQGLDPSKGANDRVSDFQAHLRAVFSRDGILYCDFDLRRDKPPQMVEHSLDLYAQWGGCQELVVEDNEGSGLLVPEFDRVARLKNLAVPLIGFTQTLNKERRIASLAPWFNRGVIRFKRNRSGLIAANQAKDFPGGDHDDAVDVLELVWGRVKAFYGLA